MRYVRYVCRRTRMRRHRVKWSGHWTQPPDQMWKLPPHVHTHEVFRTAAFGRFTPSTSPRTAFRFCLLNGLLGRLFIINGASKLPRFRFEFRLLLLFYTNWIICSKKSFNQAKFKSNQFWNESLWTQNTFIEKRM